ncbi:MAG: NAD(P)-binding protein [Azospirillaceae bacterium]
MPDRAPSSRQSAPVIAVIGAGMAGATAAGALAARGHRVRLFDKGRGPGGRMASRRLALDTQERRFDHGAQYFTARDAGFRAAAAGWQAAGVVAPWHARLARIGRHGAVAEPDTEERLVGLPSMSALIRHLTDPLDIAWGVEIAGVAAVADGWRLSGADGADHGCYDIVLLAIPPDQARALLPQGLFAEALDRVRLAPCFAAMVDADGGDAGFDAAVVEDGGPLAWIARQGSKPGRAEDGWVVHATPDWTLDHLDDDRQRVGAVLADRLGTLLGAGPTPVPLAVHRWLYARTLAPLGRPCLYDAARGIGLAGDWCLSARVEAAWLSGRALAEAVIDAVGHRG